MGTSSAPVPHTHTPSYGRLRACTPESKQTASEHEKKKCQPESAGQRKTTNMSFSLTPGKAEGSCQHLAFCIAESREDIQAQSQKDIF